jgi:hypothetical protein
MARLDVTIITMKDRTTREVRNGSVIHPNITFNTLEFNDTDGYRVEVKLSEVLSIRTAHV